jgi:hypothetical protein
LVAIVASFSIGVYANKVIVQQVSGIGGNEVLVPAPELQIVNNFWRIDANQSLVTSIVLQVTTVSVAGSTAIVNKFYQIVVQVSCLNAAGVAYTCSVGTGVIVLPSNMNGNTAILQVKLNKPIDPEVTEIDDLSFIVTGYVVPSSTPGVIVVTPNPTPTLNSNLTAMLPATLMSINGFAGTVELTAMSPDPGVAVSLSPQPYPPAPSENITLTAGGSAQVTVQVNAQGAIASGPYLVTASLSCINCPSANVVLGSSSWWVNAPLCTGSVLVTSNPTSLTMLQLAPLGLDDSPIQTVTVSLTSVCGFAGNVTLIASIPSNGLSGNVPPTTTQFSATDTFPVIAETTLTLPPLTLNATGASPYFYTYYLTLTASSPTGAFVAFNTFVPIHVEIPPS